MQKNNLKKLNAVLTIITLVALISHIVLTCMCFVTKSFAFENYIVFAWILLALLCCHVILGLYCLFSTNISSITKYPKYNKSMIVQVISALCMGLFSIPHIITFKIIFKDFASGSPIPIGLFCSSLILNILLFSAITIHISISFKKALITLGVITKTTTLRIVFWILFIIMAAICSASIFIFTNDLINFIG